MEMLDDLADGLDGWNDIPYYAMFTLAGIVVGAFVFGRYVSPYMNKTINRM